MLRAVFVVIREPRQIHEMCIFTADIRNMQAAEHFVTEARFWDWKTPSCLKHENGQKRGGY